MIKKIRRICVRFLQWKLLLVLATLFLISLNVLIMSENRLLGGKLAVDSLSSRGEYFNALKAIKTNSRDFSEVHRGRLKTEKYQEGTDAKVLFERLSDKISKLQSTLNELQLKEDREVEQKAKKVERNEAPKTAERETEKSPTKHVEDDTTTPSPTITFTRDCSVPKDDNFPLCKWKFGKFKEHWDSRCHGEKFRVNMSDPCSVLIYLSEVEAWCPPFPWRQQNTTRQVDKLLAVARTDIEGLLKLLSNKNYAWIRMRAQSFWDEWIEAYKTLEAKQNMKGRQRKRIFLFMGAFIANKFFFEDAFKGGPLGELVQWTDIMCSLYILGHDLVISSSIDDLKSGNILTNHERGCAVKDVNHDVDFIISDITGSVIIQNTIGVTFLNYRCKQLLLDSFGTEPEFNYQFYKEAIPGGRSIWADMNVNPQQLMTMYPHSPDNLFMGFAVPQKLIRTMEPPKKKMQGLVYGKLANYFRGKQTYLDILHKYMEIHANTAGPEHELETDVPKYVINHGIVNGSELMRILRQSKVFIGLGFPYEGPAPLDAIANGCFYINPKLIPPQNRENAAFFRDKPTFRKVTSQNPYAEDFIGKPYVYTIDMNNETEIENAIKEILASKEVPHLPYEFSHEGMIQRLNYYINNLDFCTPGKQWLPKQEMITLTGEAGQSCKDICFKKGYLCEPSLFKYLNTVAKLKSSGFRCQTYKELESLYAPSYNSTDASCLLQDQPLLYSCVAHNDHITRLCPCRTHQKEQVAL